MGRLDDKMTQAQRSVEQLRVSHAALLRAAKLALPGLRHLARETSFAGVAADADMAANKLEAAIAEAEKGS